jgi:hypothetical protein
MVLQPSFWFYAAYVVAMVAVWGWLVWDDAHDRDRDALLIDGAMLISAIAGAASLIAITFGVQGIRGFLIALFLGGFLGAGIVRLTTRIRRT